MQNNDNQTNQKDPHNRGQNGFESISPGLCSIWLGWRDSNPRPREFAIRINCHRNERGGIVAKTFSACLDRK